MGNYRTTANQQKHFEKSQDSKKKYLDYQKAFDSVTHEWLLRSLKLAKVPPQLISAIEKLTKHLATIASLHGTNETIITEIIKYLNGIFQGDTLSVLLFVLCLNPLSF